MQSARIEDSRISNLGLNLTHTLGFQATSNTTTPQNVQALNNLVQENTLHRQKIPASAWALEYKKCTLAELRKFIKSRANLTRGKALRKSRSDKLSLIIRLRKLDQAATLPRFMELPSKLRLAVYELLLVDTRESGGSGECGGDEPEWSTFTMHPPASPAAILCASKQIYSEAQSLLQKGNKSDGESL